jgi:hypothetical protein
MRGRLLLILLFTVLVAPISILAKGGGGFGGGGGRSFGGGGGSRSFGGGSFSRPSAPAPSRTFSSPKAAPAPAPSRPASSSGGFSTKYDSGAAAAQRSQSSRSLYEQANGISHGSSAAERVGPVSDETLRTRPAREREVFTQYTTQPIPVYYHDSFSPWFWLWLMDRTQSDRDMWIYNHRDEMDNARYNDLLRKDADLQRRMDALQQQGVTPDPSYTPAGVDQDLMYNDDQVNKAYEATKSQSHFPWGLTFIGVSAAAFAYLIFFVPMIKHKPRVY